LINAQFVDNVGIIVGKPTQALGADIGFADESWIQGNTRSGRTWGLIGHPPEIKVSDDRSGFHMLSMVTATGELTFEVTTEKLVSAVFIEFLKQVLEGRERPLIVIADNASYHTSKEVKAFLETHRQQIRLFFFPPHSPELNPDEQVWNEIKNGHLEKEPIKNRADFRQYVYSALIKLKEFKERVKSFFGLPDTQYVSLEQAQA